MARRVILITGANGTLGLAIGRCFLEESADNRVYLGVRRNRDRADALAGKYPEAAVVVNLDVTCLEEWKTAVEEIIGREGRLDVLVNNAGGHDDGLLATMAAETWRTVLSTNLDSTFYGSQAVLPQMISQRAGRIINIASVSAILAPAGQTNYAAAKAGVVALTQSLAKEVARMNITVNAVAPGYIEGAAVEINEAARQGLLGRVPMRRFGKPEEIAAAVRFLACADASYITGSLLKIDGGIF